MPPRTRRHAARGHPPKGTFHVETQGFEPNPNAGSATESTAGSASPFESVPVTPSGVSPLDPTWVPDSAEPAHVPSEVRTEVVAGLLPSTDAPAPAPTPAPAEAPAVDAGLSSFAPVIEDTLPQATVPAQPV